MGSGSVSLAARTDGLLPFWIFLILIVIWSLALVYFWRGRKNTPERLPRLAVGGALLLANVLFFWRPLFTGAHLPQGGGDLNSFFFTLHAYSAERVTNFEIPLWNPYLHGGMPHLGNFQAGFLYPPNLIAYFVSQPFSYATLEWLAIIHYLVASVGTYLLLRSLGAGRIGAVAGGLIFAYGGFFVAHLGHYSMISAAAWIPFIFWAIHRLVARGNWWSMVLLALFVFLTASAGHQQTLLFALGGGGVWWLFLLASRAGVCIPGVGSESEDDARVQGAWAKVWSRANAVSVSQFAVAIGTGLLLAAPMILPSLQLAQRSVRSTLSIEQASEFSVQPVALLHLVLPTVFGSNPTDYWSDFSSGEIWGYVGVTTLVVAAIGLAIRATPHRVFFGVLAAIAILYAVGPAAPLHGWFYQFIPGFDLVRAPARAYLFMNLAVAILAGLAISDLTGRFMHMARDWEPVIERALKVVLVIVGVTSLFIMPIFYTQILGVNEPSNRPVITVDNLWMMLLYLSLLLGVLWLVLRQALRGAALGVVLVSLLVLDLFSATMPFNPTEEDLVSNYRDAEVMAFLQENIDANDPYRIDVQHPGTLPNFGAIEGFHNASGVYDPMQPAAYTGLYDALSEAPEQPAYDLLNIRYMIVDPDAESVPGFEQVFESSEGREIWERESALPRAWFVREVMDVEHQAQIDVVRDPDFEPENVVVIEDPPQETDGNSTGSVEIVEYRAEEITLAVEADAPGYVVISDGDYPDWTAKIDGSNTELVTANYGIRAVPVDENTSEIVLAYQPRFVTAGLIASGLGGVILLGMIVAPLVISRLSAERGASASGYTS